MAITGPLGFLLSQNAFQAGTLISPVLSVITVVDPLVSIGIAVLLLHEKLASSPRDIAVEVISLTVMAVGIVALSRRAPHIVTHLPRDSHLVGQPENEPG